MSGPAGNTRSSEIRNTDRQQNGDVRRDDNRSESSDSSSRLSGTPSEIFIAEGKALGLSGADLIKYVREEREAAEKREREREEREAAEKREREDREATERREREQREMQFRMRDMEIQHEREMRELEIAQMREANATRPDTGGSDKTNVEGLKLRMPYLDDKDDIESGLCQFERLAKLQNWEKETWATRLGTLLKGKLRDVYTRLSDEEAEDYDVLKSALLRRFQLTSESYRKKFRSARKDSGESFPQFLTRLNLWFDRWCQLSGKAETREELLDLILQEQLMDSMTPELATFVRERKPTNAKEAAEYAETYVEARRPLRKPGNGYPKIHQQSIATGDKGNGGMKMDNSKYYTTSDSRSRKPETGSRRCYACGSSDHLRRDCPKMRREQTCFVAHERQDDCEPKQANKKLCKACQGIEFEQNCIVRVNGEETKGIRDTGASLSVVAAKFVTEEDYTGSHRRVTFASGKEEEVPVAKVHLDTPYFEGVTDVLVMKDPVHPVLVGNRTKNDRGRPVPVYPVREVVAPVVTRGQEKRERDEKTSLKIPPTLSEDVTPDDIRREQMTDPTLAKMRQRAGEKKNDGKMDLTWEKGILFRKYTDKNGRHYKQLIVPKKYRSQVMRLAHDTPMAGHLGTRKTRERIWQEFYWPGIVGDIKRYCMSCDVCQRTSHKGLVKKAPLGKMPIIDTPFKRVGVDIIGPIKPMSDSGKQYILVMIDFSTRYPEATALKDIRTETVAEALFEMWTRLGLPKEVLSDRGSQFVADTMKEVHRLLSIRGLNTTPYHPQGNGLTERFNSTLKDMLKKLTMEQPREWDRYIPALLFAYREVPQESTGFSPFELLYGRTVKGPMQILRELWTNEDLDGEVKTTATYVTDLQNRIEETCKLAQENLKKASEKQAAFFNRRAKRRELKIGSRVLVLLPVKKNKLELAWKGPFEVIEKMSPVNYRIKQGQKRKLYHINLLKEYNEREPSLTRKEEKTATKISEAEEGEEEVAFVIHEESTGTTESETMPGDEIPTPSVTAKESYQDVQLGPQLTEQQREQVGLILKKYQSVLTDLPLKTDLEECTFTMYDDKPVNVKQYPLPYSQLQVVKEEVHVMLEMGVIEPSSSPYNAPIVLVKKKDGNVRFCVDYRQLNKKTVFDAEPLPDVDYLFTKVAKAKYLTKCDLSRGFWQVPVREEDRPKTAFSTPSGQFQWVTMPFGLQNAGSIFTRMMRKLLDPLDRDDVDNFMDDILIATETWEQHLEALEAVLRRLEEANLSAKPSKCFVGFHELAYLGHQIGDGKVWPEPEKIEKIQKAKEPETKKELRAFLGLTGYYRKFVPEYSQIATPLTDKTKKNEPDKIQWDEESRESFHKLKERLVCKPIMKLPQQDKDYVLRTDASNRGIGAVLMQDSGEGLQPVAYASKKLRGSELNYATVEKECMAVVWGIKKFERYLFGRHFTLETDHQPLQHLQRMKPSNGRLMRWAMYLQQYTFTVRVIPGAENVGADFLSRVNCD